MMGIQKLVCVVCCVITLIVGCSRQQSDWEKARATNTSDSYELFLKQYPASEFTGQAQARAKELYEEHDWQKARDTDTQDAYQTFLKQHPEGKFTEEARIRVENSQALSPGVGAASAASAASAAGAVGAPGEVGGVDALKPEPAPAKPAEKPAGAKPNTTMPSAQIASPKGFGVQLGAFSSGPEAANQRWTHLSKAYPAILSGLHSKVSQVTVASGPVYRLQVVGLSEKKAAAVCKELKAKAQACVTLRPSHS